MGTFTQYNVDALPKYSVTVQTVGLSLDIAKGVGTYGGRQVRIVRIEQVPDNKAVLGSHVIRPYHYKSSGYANLEKLYLVEVQPLTSLQVTTLLYSPVTLVIDDAISMNKKGESLGRPGGHNAVIVKTRNVKAFIKQTTVRKEYGGYRMDRYLSSVAEAVNATSKDKLITKETKRTKDNTVIVKEQPQHKHSKPLDDQEDYWGDGDDTRRRYRSNAKARGNMTDAEIKARQITEKRAVVANE